MSREQRSPARRPPDREIEREARRILPQLAADGARLVARKAAGASRQTYQLLVQAGAGASGVAAEVSSQLVDAFRRNEWLAEEGGAIRLADAGRAWLKRSNADADPFRRQHQACVETTREIAGDQRPVVVNEAESPLSWLRRRKDKAGAPLISDVQFQAGERLRADFWRAHMMPHVTSNWGSSAPSRRTRRGPDSHSIGDDVLAAKQRVLRALAAVGPELSGILIDVCCHLQGLADAERGHGWPQRSGKVILQIALTRLARHYGLISDAEAAAPVRQRLRHWGTEDYKPNLQAWR